MNYPAAMFYLTLVMTIINAIIGISVWWNNREKVTNARFKKSEERVTKVEARVSTVETKVEAMPVCSSHSRMEANDTKLMDRLDDLHGDIRELAGGVKGLSRAVDLMNEHLINKGK